MTDARETLAAEAYEHRFPGSSFARASETTRAKWLGTYERATVPVVKRK